MLLFNRYTQRMLNTTIIIPLLYIDCFRKEMFVAQRKFPVKYIALGGVHGYNNTLVRIFRNSYWYEHYDSSTVTGKKKICINIRVFNAPMFFFYQYTTCIR